MIFRFIDRVIDRQVASGFNFLRKIGRRTEAAYYTAYKDWLVFLSRRTKDMSVKITMIAICTCVFILFRGIKVTVKILVKDNHVPMRKMVEQLDEFNEELLHPKPSDADDDETLYVNRKNMIIIRDYFQQADK